MSPGRLQAWQQRFIRLSPVIQGAAYSCLLVLFVAMGEVEVPFVYLQF